VEYLFYTNEPNEAVKKLRPIQSRFTLVMRGGKWLADDRASNFEIIGSKRART
jgi:hypothetical protein